MPTERDTAGHNLGTLLTYAPESYRALEKKCRADDGRDKNTRRNMVDFMILKGFAKEQAPGHGSGKPGNKMQPATVVWIKSVQRAIN
jgi:hypothetical protein